MRVSRAERLNAILNLLAASGQVEVDDIVSRLDVSPATARRDLDSLAGQRLLTRTRGGAIPHSVAYELPVRDRAENASDVKQRIAAEASRLIAPGDVIGLSGGTTTTAIATVPHRPIWGAIGIQLSTIPIPANSRLPTHAARS